MSGAQNLVPAATAVDHLLLGTSDLDEGIAWLEKRTGVRATIGGSHPGVGTRNALVSLGRRQYLEIIAPDPAQSSDNSRFDLRKLTEPRLITWAAASSDVDGLAKKAVAAGRKVFGPQPGSRVRPDGKTLQWKSFGVLANLAADGIDPIPFFIEWAKDTLHPSQDSPKCGELQSLGISHADPASVRATLELLGIEATIQRSDRCTIRATIATSRGPVELT